MASHAQPKQLKQQQTMHPLPVVAKFVEVKEGYNELFVRCVWQKNQLRVYFDESRGWVINQLAKHGFQPRWKYILQSPNDNKGMMVYRFVFTWDDFLPKTFINEFMPIKLRKCACDWYCHCN